jgi:hypothetical protein
LENAYLRDRGDGGITLRWIFWELGCEDGRWVEPAQNRVLLRALVFELSVLLFVSSKHPLFLTWLFDTLLL